MTPWIAEPCSDVASTPVNWLWPRYLPRGKIAIFDGDPEMGKSLITIDLLARLSRGATLPDGSPGPGPTTSILLSAEDDPGDTIRPRAEAAGADLYRLVLPKFGGEIPRLPDDVPALKTLVQDLKAGIVVIDPLMAFLPPNLSANFDQYVRRALTPLTLLATQTDCAILFIRHLTKRQQARAIHRGQGSMGILAAVRTAWFAAAHPNDPTLRVLTMSKSSMGRHPPALTYRLIESASGQPVVEWVGPVDLTADMVGRVPEGTLPARDRACIWLQQQLANGPRKATEIYAAAAAAGIPERTLERAKAELRVKSHRVNDRKSESAEWYWSDPCAPWPKDAPFKKLDDPFYLPDI